MKKLILLLFLLPYALWGQSHISVFDQEMGVDIVDFVKHTNLVGNNRLLCPVVVTVEHQDSSCAKIVGFVPNCGAGNKTMRQK